MNIDKVSQSNLSPHGAVSFSHRSLNHADFGKTIRTIYTYIYLDPNEMSGRSYFCTCPQTILLSEKETRICMLFTHR